MASRRCCRCRPLPIAVWFLLLLFFVAGGSSTNGISPAAANLTSTSPTYEELRLIRARLRRLNKPAVETFQTPEGDTIDCVLSHLQPAFDHPLLKGQKPLDAPDEMPVQVEENSSSVLHTWPAFAGREYHSCPEGTVAIRRITEEDLLRAGLGSLRKPPEAAARSVLGGGSNGRQKHEHAVGYVKGGNFYGAKAVINVWKPHVAVRKEFSLSQMWVIYHGPNGNIHNTIEAGWQVCRHIYGDDRPRLFIYWTADGYHSTGCYNLFCSGFVHTSRRIALGSPLSPTSSYGGKQFEITLLIWKDKKSGNWWLKFGKGHGELLGYWPAALFTGLKEHANMVEFGGEITDSHSSPHHTETQMGSGHFPKEGFRKAAYLRNLQVVHSTNTLVNVDHLHSISRSPACYDITIRKDVVWGNYLYQGGPGKNPRCF